jgi:hypothetical protein
MENLENNKENILDQEDDGKTFAGGALFGDDVEVEESEIQEEVAVEHQEIPATKEEKPKKEKAKKEEAKKEEPVKAEDPNEEVPLFSSANLFKFGLGELKKGYNLIKRKDAEQWLKHRKVRLATARELARYYGKE